MTCEALVIGSLAGLALTGAVLSFQAITDRKAAARKTPKLKEGKTSEREKPSANPSVKKLLEPL
jgi:hypothetical protein